MTKKASEKPHGKQTDDAPPPRRRVRVLVAEDNNVNQKVILQQLKNLGYVADAVGNGLEAIQALDHVPYDLILMDCQMPEMDGYAATAIIRQREPEGRHIPIIAMTAHVMTGDREKCLSSGMDDYVPKPLKTENLTAVLSRWINEQKKVDEKGTNPLNDPAFVEQVGRIFLQETPKYLATMRKAQKKRDPKSLSIAAHSLAGSCCIVGTKRLKELSRLVEEKVKARETRDIPSILQELDQEFKVVKKTLRTGPRRYDHESSHSR